MVAKVGHSMTHGEQGSPIFDLANVFRGVWSPRFSVAAAGTLFLLPFAAARELD